MPGAAQPVTDRSHRRGDRRASSRRAGGRHGVRAAEAAAERGTRKRHPPKSRSEIASLHGDQQRPGASDPGERRSCTELPLRADEQPA